MPQHRSGKVGTLMLQMAAIASLCFCISSATAQQATLGRGVTPPNNGGQGGASSQQQVGPQQGGYYPQDAAIQPIGQRQQAQAPIPQDAFLPRPFPALNQKHEEYLDQLLGYWEYSSSQIEMFECKFNRYVYDPVFGPKERDERGGLLAKTISSGTIKYKGPDKGLFSVEGIWAYQGSAQPDDNPYQLVKMPDNSTNAQERWICDGKSVFSYEYENQRIIKMTLPPEMQGQGLRNGPLPFLFGAKKDELKSRYWLRVITPEGAVGEYWIEAYPKFPMDARNYQKVVVVLDEKDFLPKATELFDSDFDPQTKPGRQVFDFKDREIFDANALSIKGIIDRFKREFFEPKAPRGWEIVEQPYGAETANAAPVGFQR